METRKSYAWCSIYILYFPSLHVLLDESFNVLIDSFMRLLLDPMGNTGQQLQLVASTEPEHYQYDSNARFGMTR